MKGLDLDTVTNDIPYTLSQPVLHANSLTVLKLANMNLNMTDFVTLKSLKVLSLKNVYLDDESAHIMISSCSSLEQLDLRFCFGLKRLRILNSNLKALEIGHWSCSRIEVEATNLVTFSYAGRWIDDFGRLGFNGKLTNLADLRMCLRAIKDAMSLQSRISLLARLKKLKLTWRKGARYFKICNENLKHLVLDSHKKLCLSIASLNWWVDSLLLVFESSS